MPHRRSHFATANKAEMVSFETTAQLLENLWVNRADTTLADQACWQKPANGRTLSANAEG